MKDCNIKQEEKFYLGVAPDGTKCAVCLGYPSGNPFDKLSFPTGNMIFLTMGTGGGCGIILNGQLYEGVSGMAG